jgi:hypothetical protein
MVQIKVVASQRSFVQRKVRRLAMPLQHGVVEVVVELPQQGLRVRAEVTKVPLMVLGRVAEQQPEISAELKRRAFAEVWWPMRARFIGHARLGYATMPFGRLPVRPSGKALDPDAAHCLSWRSRVDVRSNHWLRGLSIAWLDDASVELPVLRVLPIDPPGEPIEVGVLTISGFATAVSSVPLSVVCRWAFVPAEQLRYRVGESQGVLGIQTEDLRLFALVRWDAGAGRVIAAELLEQPVLPETLPEFSSVWWEVWSYQAGFPQKTHNNEQRPSQPPEPAVAQDVVRTVDFRRELFLDGPGWLLDGAPSLYSLVVDLLEESVEEDFVVRAWLGGSELERGRDFGAATVRACADISTGELSPICLRFVWIPAAVVAAA